MKRAEVLDEAKICVTRDRAATHGKVENTFGMIAGLWSVRLGVTVTPEQACIMMMDLKTSRAWDNPQHTDNWVDMAGYAACGGELATLGSTPGDKWATQPTEAIVIERALRRSKPGPYVPDPDLREEGDVL